MKGKLTKLRNKLPYRNYVDSIIEADKAISGRKKKARFTRDQVRNFFRGLPVDQNSKVLIINATREAIKKKERIDKSLKRLLEAA